MTLRLVLAGDYLKFIQHEQRVTQATLRKRPQVPGCAISTAARPMKHHLRLDTFNLQTPSGTMPRCAETPHYHSRRVPPPLRTRLGRVPDLPAAFSTRRLTQNTQNGLRPDANNHL